MGNSINRQQRKKKKELLHCSICFNVFHIPRMLPCQHTFCEACLQSYISTTMEAEVAESDFPCPVCRVRTHPPQTTKPRSKWAQQFPKNRIIVSLCEGEPETPEFCTHHPGKVIEFFCESHVEIACSSCLLARHKSCKIASLDEFVEDGRFKRICRKNNEMLMQYKKLFDDLAGDVEKNLDRLEVMRDDIIDTTKQIRTNVIELFDRFEQQMISSIHDTYDRECAQLRDQTVRCRKVALDIDDTLQKLVTAQKDIKMVHKAQTVVLVEEQLDTFSSLMKEEHDQFNDVSLSLTTDPLIEQMMTSLGELGKVMVKRVHVDKSLPEVRHKTNSADQPELKRHRNKHVTKVSEHKVSRPGESYFCNITSSVVMADNRVVIADDSNCKLKVLDHRLHLTDNELKLVSNPLNMALVSETEVAVSMPSKRAVLIVAIEKQMMCIRKTIKTRLDCWGVEVVDDTIIVTTGRDGHSVVLMDLTGKELNSFILTSHQDDNIRCPVAVTADKKNMVLYITCTGGAWSKGCVIATDFSGTLLHVYNDADIDTPRNCALDRHGKFYICGLESSTVYQLATNGDVFKLFPSRYEEVIGPLHMNFIKNFHIRFLLTEVASDIIKVFELPLSK